MTATECYNNATDIANFVFGDEAAKMKVRKAILRIVMRALETQESHPSFKANLSKIMQEHI